MSELGAVLESLRPTGVLAVGDRRVVELHGWPEPLRDVAQARLHAGPETKRVAVWRSLLDALVDGGIDRDGVLVAYGGGTVLDVAGFAAASYLRGIRWVSVATTLLAQVDAAHGGKTGIDHERGKNLIGAFHTPEAVLTPPDVLATLDALDVRCGLAEIIKHGVIARPDLIERAGRDEPATLVEDAKQVKLDIVARDAKEHGERRHLNLGHTLGHAVEQAGGYRMAHGDAVAVGLRAACFLAKRHAGFTQAGAVIEALDRCGHPKTAKAPIDAVRAALGRDKKRRGAQLRWVLPKTLGDVAVYDDVPDALVGEAIHQFVED